MFRAAQDPGVAAGGDMLICAPEEIPLLGATASNAELIELTGLNHFSAYSNSDAVCDAIQPQLISQ